MKTSYDLTYFAVVLPRSLSVERSMYTPPSNNGDNGRLGRTVSVEFVIADERKERRSAQNRKAQRNLRSMLSLLPFGYIG